MTPNYILVPLLLTGLAACSFLPTPHQTDVRLVCDQGRMLERAEEHFKSSSEHEDARRARQLAAAYLQQCGERRQRHASGPGERQASEA